MRPYHPYTPEQADLLPVSLGDAIPSGNRLELFLGAAIGAIAGGGKGAAIGAATGAGAGTAGVLLSRGKPLVLSPETVLSFQLTSPVTVEFVPGQASDVSTVTRRRIPPAPDNWNRPRLRRRPGGRTGRLF